MNKKEIAVMFGLSACLLNSAEALDVGEAQVRSFLGQPLNVFVPVIDVDEKYLDFSQLIISTPSEELISNSGNRKIAVQRFNIIKDSSNKGVYITSIEPVNDTFVDFALKFNYKGVSQLNKFTVLIDLKSNAIATSIPSVEIEQNQSKNTVTTLSNSSLNSKIMGPYEWAQAGNIPEKFGPVIDGQSLWRVARRINEAMDVSVDQMMWGLYRANQTAFLTENVDSLLSGSTLIIPDRSFITEFTELAANRLVNGAIDDTIETISTSPILVAGQEIGSGIPMANDTPIANPISGDPVMTLSSDIRPETTIDKSELSNIQASLIQEPVVLEKLQNSSISDVAVSDSVEFEQGISLSQISVIEQLQSEVASLNEQLSAQSSRILSLEQRISEFESFADSGVVIQKGQLASSSSISSKKPFKDNKVLSPLVLIGLVATAAIAFILWLAYINRSFIGRCVERISGGKIEFDEESPSFLYAFSKRRELRRNLNVVEERYSNTDDEAEATSDNKPEQKKDDFDDDFLIDSEYESHVEELSFPERINQLIDEGEFEEAKKVMKFASKLDFEEGYLNLCLLKIFMAQSDNDRFSKLFEEIKPDMDGYSSDIQLQISELQAEMAVEDIIEYSQEKLG